MLKAYRYRIYPNKEQEIQLAKTFGCCRFVYNQTLAYRKDAYEKEKKSVSKTDCNNYIVLIKSFSKNMQVIQSLRVSTVIVNHIQPILQMGI